MMAISDAEKRFEKHRDNLRREVGLLADYVDLFRRLHKRRRNYCFEINSAPTFFSLVTRSVFSTIILWTNKLLDEKGQQKGQRGIFDFLKFIEDNTGVFSIEQLNRRRNFPDNHWVLERRRTEGEITARQVARHRERLSNLRCLKSLRIRRDRYHAHFDKKYFFDLDRLDLDAPIALKDFGNAVKALWAIVNKYSWHMTENSMSRRQLTSMISTTSCMRFGNITNIKR
jgi:AbiU2